MTEEYRRFLALVASADEPLWPPDTIDRAWRLHVTRSADYARFCRQAFGRFLHRQPPADEGARSAAC
ncbi:MAG TPA: hypothetical protein VF457_18560, partial [Burkholderiaceae bacterium]